MCGHCGSHVPASDESTCNPIIELKHFLPIICIQDYLPSIVSKTSCILLPLYANRNLVFLFGPSMNRSPDS